MVLTNRSRFILVFILWLFTQFSSFPECISLPVPKSLCPTFGPFYGTFNLDFECCLDEDRCPITVDKSLLYESIFLNLRGKRSPVEITASEIPERRTRTLDTLELNLCEIRTNTIQPIYGTRVKSGEKIQILQIPTVFAQTVVQYTCSGEPAKLIRGNCVQQYKPEELYTVSTAFNSEYGEGSTVIKRDFVWVEAGCRTTVDLTSFIPDLSEKLKYNTPPLSPISEITPVLEIKKKPSLGFVHSFSGIPSSISENKSTSVELGYNLAGKSNPKFTLSELSTDEPKIPYHTNPNTNTNNITDNMNTGKTKTSLGRSSQDQNQRVTSHNQNYYTSTSADELSTKSEHSPALTQVERDQEILKQQESSKFAKINESSYSYQFQPNERIEHQSVLEESASKFAVTTDGDEKADISGSGGLEPLTNQHDAKSETLPGRRAGLSRENEYLQGISNKIGLPLFIHSFEFDPVKNLIST